MFERIIVAIPEWAIPHWWIFAYKIPPPLEGDFQELVQIGPDARFEKVVGGYVTALIQEGKMPPPDIAPAIVNLANDLLSGRDMTIRTGDYIAIQNHLRG